MRKYQLWLCLVVVIVIGVVANRYLTGKDNVDWVGIPAFLNKHSLFTVVEPSIEFGLRGDGVVIWREVKP